MMSIAERIAAALLEIEAVKLQPHDRFTWASGIRSPIYTDNRVALGFPLVRDLIKAGLADIVRSYPKAQAVVGVATAGIPHAALVADALGLPMAYVRASAKQHGRQNQIEGRLAAGDRVVLIEDLISTGGSSLEAVEVLRAQGVEVLATAAIFSYGFPSAETRFAEADCPLHYLCDYPTLLKHAVELGRIRDADLADLEAWRTETSATLSQTKTA